MREAKSTQSLLVERFLGNHLQLEVSSSFMLEHRSLSTALLQQTLCTLGSTQLPVGCITLHWAVNHTPSPIECNVAVPRNIEHTIFLK